VLSQARMAMDATEAMSMVVAAREHPDLVTLLVPASHTFSVDGTVRRMLRDGAIGDLRTVDAAWNEPEIVEAGEWWRHLRRYSGNNLPGIGALYEFLVRWLGPAESVMARTDLFEPKKPGPDGEWIRADLPDHVSMLVTFGGGVQANLEVSTHSAAGGPSQVTLLGSTGILRVDLRQHRLERAPAGSSAFEEVSIDPAEREEWRVESEFIEAIRGEGEVRRNPFKVGLEYMRFSDTVVASAAEGSAMPIRRGD
jgi:predicted dehydrogenase